MCQQDQRKEVSGLYEGYMFIYCVDFHTDAKKNGKHSPHMDQQIVIWERRLEQNHI